MLEEVYENADLLEGFLLGDPFASTDTLSSSNNSPDPQGTYLRRSSLLSSLYHAINLSTPSEWCQNRDGVRHEFLLLKVERPEHRMATS
ncbi:hypothetical protein BS47DRAFT_1397619 [Hydnum rufescens UP504]|uniref:Uncharacterized protein n=1 Tax=Hydnum rufescens UP504 TaxID=1448309 RepID=A0A9P6AN57_9AGAM|nr:hypothetical protein BS47DRAFT_1397619 [Hydnum rufescens UP504]